MDIQRVNRKKVEQAYHEPIEVDSFYTGGLRDELDQRPEVGDIFVRDDGTALLKTSGEWTELLNSL